MNTLRSIPVRIAVLFACLMCVACSSREPGEFVYTSASDSSLVRYTPGPPGSVYDSLLLHVALKPGMDPGTDSLVCELLPAQGGWSRPASPYIVRDSSGWYRTRAWVCPTEPGQFVMRWQTAPFTGFTYYLSAWYDSSGHLVKWDHEPDNIVYMAPLLARDTMEIVYQYWPQVWYRRVHLEPRAGSRREFWVITQSYQRGAGVSGRRIQATANLTFDPQFPLRTRQWSEPGWVTDTLSVRVRDTLVAWIAWSYEEFVENWEKSLTLFREWNHRQTPQFHFRVDANGHLSHIWRTQPEGFYIAAKMLADTSRPAFDSVKKAFITAPPGEELTAEP